MKSRKFYHRRLTVIILTMLVMAGIGYFTLFRLPLFQVLELNVIGVGDVDSAIVHGVLWQKLGKQNIFKIKEADLERIVSKTIPSYKFIELKQTLPNKVTVIVEPRIRKYIVSTNSESYVVDENGFVYGVTDDDADVFYDENLFIGTFISDPLLRGALIYSFSESKIIVKDGEITISIKDGGKVILPENAGEKEAVEISNILQKILQKYTIEGRGIEFVDMRFSKPVVKFK